MKNITVPYRIGGKWARYAHIATALSLVILGLLLYIPLRSIQWDLNGLYEAQGVEAGGAALFSPNHMLYRPLGYAIYHLAQWCGYVGPSAPLLQCLTAVLAALGLGCVFLAVYSLTLNQGLALFASLLIALSGAYWAFSTDIYYITPAALTVAAALALLLRRSPSGYSMLGTGFLGGLAILFWQANIFLGPILIGGCAWRTQSRGFRARSRWTAVLLLGLMVPVIATYAVVGVVVYDYRELAEFQHWLLSHSSDGGGRPEMWGKWSVERIPLAIFNALASFTLAPSEMLQREVGASLPTSLAFFCLSLGAFLLLLGLSARRLCLSYSHKTPGIQQVLGLLACYALYWPFIIWWDPYEIKWFVVPNLFLAAALAKLWSLVPSARPGRVWVCVAVIASANFVMIIWPRHAIPNPNIEIAACLTTRVHSSDLLIALSWSQYDYAAYFYGSRIQAISVLQVGSTLDDRLELIERTVATIHRQGGHVYMKAANDHSPLEVQTLRFIAGLTPQDFSQLAQRPAFTCNSKQFVEVLERYSAK